MNRQQKIAVGAAAANLVVMLLFPPFDEFTAINNRVATFAGFQFFARPGAHAQLNQNLLALELIVVLVNFGIAWLLLRTPPPGGRSGPSRAQSAVLGFIAVNLMLVLLFPPFENARALSNATLPSFEGFYFIFAPAAGRVVVVSILWLEVFFLLINGGLLWLLLRERPRSALTAEEAMRVARELRRG